MPPTTSAVPVAEPAAGHVDCTPSSSSSANVTGTRRRSSPTTPTAPRDRHRPGRCARCLPVECENIPVTAGPRRPSTGECVLIPEEPVLPPNTPEKPTRPTKPSAGPPTTLLTRSSRSPRSRPAGTAGHRRPGVAVAGAARGGPGAGWRGADPPLPRLTSQRAAAGPAGVRRALCVVRAARPPGLLSAGGDEQAGAPTLREPVTGPTSAEPDREDGQRHQTVGPRELARLERGVAPTAERVEQQVERLERERPQVGDRVATLAASRDRSR